MLFTNFKYEMGVYVNITHLNIIILHFIVLQSAFLSIFIQKEENKSILIIEDILLFIYL